MSCGCGGCSDVFTFPAGPQGPQGPGGPAGPQGISVVSTKVDTNGDLLVTLSNNTVINAGVVKGPAGPAGGVHKLVKDFTTGLSSEGGGGASSTALTISKTQLDNAGIPTVPSSGADTTTNPSFSVSVWKKGLQTVGNTSWTYDTAANIAYDSSTGGITVTVSSTPGVLVAYRIVVIG